MGQTEQPIRTGLVLLRGGTAVSQAPIFLFPGAGGDCAELEGLVSRIACPRPLYAVKLAGSDGDPMPATVGDIADRAVEVIRNRQPSGPYQLAGYSFGGLVALEAARRLRNSGADVAATILIDSYFDARYWPARLWFRAQARRIGHHLRALRRRSAANGLAELTFRTRRLVGRAAARAGVRPPRAAPPSGAGAVSLTEAYQRIAAAYDPGSFSEPTYLLQARSSTDFGVSPAELWRPRCSRLTVREVVGDHRTLLQDPEALAELAAAFDRCLPTEATADVPRILLVTTTHWPSAAQLAASLIGSEFEVTALCPPGHPLWSMNDDVDVRRLPIVGQEKALQAALSAAAPHLVIPCDERALTLVRRAGEGPTAASIGRADVIARARAASMRAPCMDRVANAADLRTWIAQHGLPAVLKTDGSWGGLGVVILRDARDAERAYARLSSPPSTIRAVKRALLNRDFGTLRAWIRRERPTVNAQEFVEGRDANIAVACWRGELLAAISVEVLETSCTHGPATIIRVIDHAEMLATAKALATDLGLSGFVGMDFVLDAEGRAHLLELNARATPTCHLSLGPGRNLATALRRRFAGGPTEEPAAATVSPVIALYPSARPEQIARWNAWPDRPVGKVGPGAASTGQVRVARRGRGRRDAAVSQEKTGRSRMPAGNA